MRNPTDSPIDDLIRNSKAHFTYSQKKLLSEFIPQICKKYKISRRDFLQSEELIQLYNFYSDPVQKGKKIFNFIRKMRYPLSEGKDEKKMTSLNFPIKISNSKKRLVNHYFYGDGIFDLKEHVISLIRFCPLDCAYCFLRDVYNDPRFKVAPDYNQINQEITQLTNQESGIIYLNAGENADSMILDMEYSLTKKLWNIVKKYPNTYLEFRTKTKKIHKLIEITDHQKRIVAGFSLSPEEDRRVFETNTATIQERIAAMSELQQAGFVVGLRFEPILYTTEYIEKYKKLFETIFNRLNLEQIHSISLGCLRLTKGLSRLLKKSHSEILAEEWVLGTDNKFRYCKQIRIEIYQNLIGLLKKFLPNQKKIVLSTEPSEIWQSVELPFKTMPEICDL